LSVGWIRRRRRFPPEPPATLARTVERNRGRPETRTLQSAPVTAEAVGFPLAAQAARVRREVAGQAPVTVGLLTSLPPQRLDAARWLARNRQAWGIETGLHARLDVSRRDDQCRLRQPNAVWVHGMMARLANSLMMEWRSHQRAPSQKTTTDFAAWMAADHGRRVLLAVTARRPNLKTAS